MILYEHIDPQQFSIHLQSGVIFIKSNKTIIKQKSKGVFEIKKYQFDKKALKKENKHFILESFKIVNEF